MSAAATPASAASWASAGVPSTVGSDRRAADFLVVPLDRVSPPISASAALKTSSLFGFSGCGRTPDGDVSPENFCQSPVRLNSATTASLGWAPTESQYWARSESTSITDGSFLGWYLPISSMARPSRLVRESATTMR